MLLRSCKEESDPLPREQERNFSFLSIMVARKHLAGFLAQKAHTKTDFLCHLFHWFYIIVLNRRKFARLKIPIKDLLNTHWDQSLGNFIEILKPCGAATRKPYIFHLFCSSESRFILTSCRVSKWYSWSFCRIPGAYCREPIFISLVRSQSNICRGHPLRDPGVFTYFAKMT